MFRIVDAKTGIDYGTYQAHDEHDAREVFAKKASYETLLDMLEFSTIGRLSITEITKKNSNENQNRR